MREKPGYRENVALLNEMFPDQGMLTVTEVARFLGCHRSTVSRKIKFNPATGRISKVDLARQISAG